MYNKRLQPTHVYPNFECGPQLFMPTLPKLQQLIPKHGGTFDKRHYTK